MDAFGRIDVLVNNAGIWGDFQRTPLLDIDPDYWDFVMAVNVRGPLLCTRAVAPIMIAQGARAIVNISSIGAYMAAGVYGVSKLALNSLTLALATELGPSGITVNAVAPGPIDNEASRARCRRRRWTAAATGTMVKRLGDADDIYGMIRYLASDDARWVTGQTYLVNGGFSCGCDGEGARIGRDDRRRGGRGRAPRRSASSTCSGSSACTTCRSSTPSSARGDDRDSCRPATSRRRCTAPTGMPARTGRLGVAMISTGPGGGERDGSACSRRTTRRRGC